LELFSALWILGLNGADIIMVGDELLGKIGNLDDKQACFIVEQMTGEIYSEISKAPESSEIAKEFIEIAKEIDDITETIDNPLSLQTIDKWYDNELSLENSGPLARSILEAMASHEDLEPMVKKAIDELVDETLDLGILTMGAAISLVYLVASSSIHIDFKWRGLKVKIRKSGLTRKAQEKLLGKTSILSKIASMLKS
jgi:hypothetical protein